jgi:hypothetical protein
MMKRTLRLSNYKTCILAKIRFYETSNILKGLAKGANVLGFLPAFDQNIRKEG